MTREELEEKAGYKVGEMIYYWTGKRIIPAVIYKLEYQASTGLEAEFEGARVRHSVEIIVDRQTMRESVAIYLGIESLNYHHTDYDRVAVIEYDPKHHIIHRDLDILRAMLQTKIVSEVQTESQINYKARGKRG